MRACDHFLVEFLATEKIGLADLDRTVCFSWSGLACERAASSFILLWRCDRGRLERAKLASVISSRASRWHSYHARNFRRLGDSIFGSRRTRNRDNEMVATIHRPPSRHRLSIWPLDSQYSTRHVLSSAVDIVFATGAIRKSCRGKGSATCAGTNLGGIGSSCDCRSRARIDSALRDARPCAGNLVVCHDAIR